ncbi:cytochrome c4 [Ectothiorhodospiraceae bacterium BW-2]|nr:cytochrome c4 [Ectothiorhodospiraceae bacterium BW-2]
MHSLLVAGAVTMATSATAATPTAEMLGNTCAGCHGIDGSSNGPAIPSIAGIDVDYFIESMTLYQSNERPSTIMGRIARGYTAQEIELMAEFFNTKKLKTIDQTTDAALAAKGASLHDRFCEKCHEEGGRIADGSAILAAQMLPYLEYSMTDFNSGMRDMPRKMKSKMQDVKEKYGDDGFKQLVHFYASQK